MPRVPEQLLNRLRQLGHFNEDSFLAAHEEEKKLTSVRFNPFKKCSAEFETLESVPWHPDGFYLDSRPSFTLDPLFHAGTYYVQEAGSMFLHFALSHTLNFEHELRILDVSAAPGGKSTLINSMMNAGSLLVSNEIIRSRADVLTHNLSKWGTSNTLVTNSDPRRFSELHAFFDAVVLDAPCSGSGLFRKQPDAIDHWSEAAVEACAVRQKKIVEDILPSLSEDGLLFYSTCSYSPEEDEEVVDWLIAEQNMEFVKLPVDPAWGIVETGSGYRFYPHLTKSEGFFCAILRKRTSEKKQQPGRKKNGSDPSKNEMTILTPFLRESNDTIVKTNEQFHMMNTAAAHFLSNFSGQFYFKKAGVCVGQIKGKDLVPNHELALSLALNEKVGMLELNKENALKFLRKEIFETAENQKGFTLIKYMKFGLGWAKVLPNRINNYLPNELRILK